MTVSRNGQGQKLQVLTDQVCLKLPSTQSANSMTVVTVTVPAGSFVPPHTHTIEEESYYILDGSLVMRLGNEALLLEPGDFVHVPAGTVHGYQNTSSQDTHFLAWAVGGAIDRFFGEMSAEIRQLPDDLAKMPKILEKYGIKMLE